MKKLAILENRHFVFQKISPAARFYPRKMLMLNSVFRIQIRLDPFRFGHETDPGCKKSTKITRISYIFFFKNIKLLFNGHKYIFNRKKSFLKVEIFSILGLIWSRIRIRIRYPRNGSENPDPDPYQNKTDPEHWLNYSSKKFRLRRTFTN